MFLNEATLMGPNLDSEAAEPFLVLISGSTTFNLLQFICGTSGIS